MPEKTVLFFFFVSGVIYGVFLSCFSLIGFLYTFLNYLLFLLVVFFGFCLVVSTVFLRFSRVFVTGFLWFFWGFLDFQVFHRFF